MDIGTVFNFRLTMPLPVFSHWRPFAHGGVAPFDRALDRVAAPRWSKF